MISPRKRDTDLIVRLTSFAFPVVNTENKMSQTSFMDNVINNSDFKKRLEAGLIKGLFTHTGRDEVDATHGKIPYDDLIATHHELANVTRDVWVADDTSGKSAYASIDILTGTKGGDLARIHIKNKMFLGISMATRCDFDRAHHEYVIKELKGNDFTVDPAFIGSGIVQQNFSNTGEPNNINSIQNFSVIRTLDDWKNNIIVNDNFVNFSFIDWMRENNRPKYMVLSMRIRDIIRALRRYSKDELVEHRMDIQSYINDIIYNWVAAAMQSPEKININIGLRIVHFLKDPRAAQLFNTKINIIKSIYQKQKFLNRQNQTDLDSCMKILLKSLWEEIADRAEVDFNIIYSPTAFNLESPSVAQNIEEKISAI